MPLKNFIDEEHPLGDFDFEDHQLSLEELCIKYKTDSHFGLTRAEAEARLARDGKNLAFQRRRKNEFLNFMQYMFPPAALVLWAAILYSIIGIIISNTVYDEIGINEYFILGNSVFQALFIGACYYTQANPPSRLSQIIPDMAADVSEVIRDGERIVISVEEIVVGDLILLKYGDRFPADIRVVHSQNFKVVTFSMMDQRGQRILDEKMNEMNTLDNPNVVYFSGKAVMGTARGIVIRTGRRTLLGWIFSLRKDSTKFICPVTQNLIRCFNRTNTLGIVFGIIFFFVFWLVSRRKITDIFLVVLLFIVGITRENLILSMLISLKITCRKVSSRNWNVKNILAIQKFPFVKTICLNKPGVLTMNKVSVSNLWFDKKEVEVWGGSKIQPKDRNSATFKELSFCALLCNEADFQNDEQDVPITKRLISGPPNDVAVLKFLVHTIGNRIDNIKKDYPKLYAKPHNTGGRYQFGLYKHEGDMFIVLMGDPEYLLEKCTTFMMAGHAVDINTSFLKEIDEACVKFAKYGEIIKCVVQRVIPKNYEFSGQKSQIPENEFTFLGIITLSDCPRANVAKAVARCKEAGIKVLLTTSDHPIVARSFARHIGIITKENKTLEEVFEEGGTNSKIVTNAVVVDGLQMNKFSVKRINSLMATYTEIVFARISAIQRLMLVAMFQQTHSLVAVVGDTVNDSLAMRKADVSVTLTDNLDRSSLTADVILTDETFYSLVTCIEECRSLYENLRKCSALVFAEVTATILPLVVYCIIGIPYPIGPSGYAILEVLLGWFPALALTFDKGDTEVMRKPPKNVDTDSLWSRQMIFYACGNIGIIETFACFFTYFLIFFSYGWTVFSLIGIRDLWDSRAVTNLEDSIGQQWSYEERKNLEKLSQTGYIYSLVITQCINVLLCRTQTIPLFRIKNRNWIIYFSILFEIFILCCLIYLPFMNAVTYLMPLEPLWLLFPIPFMILLILYNETKIYICRKFPKGWLARETIY